MPLIRRLPKRGFNALFKNTYQVVNIGALNRFQASATVGPVEFKNAGLISSSKDRVKVLGNGKLEKTLTIKAHKFSGSAKKAIDAAGAKVELLKE